MFYLSLFLILVGGAVIFQLCKLAHLPQLVGYLAWGILLNYLGLIDQSILSISTQLRKIALIIILIKAGLSLNIQDLKKVGRPALLLSFIPACVEMCAVGLLGPIFFNITYNESFLLGSVLGAVSPAVVVPMMSRLIEEKRGTQKGIPQLIIAGSSIDDIVMIVFYTSFLSFESGSGTSALSFLNIPIAIVTGIGVGALFGFLLVWVFKKIHIRDSLKLIVIIGCGAGFVYLEEVLASYFSFSSLLSAITMGLVLSALSPVQGNRLCIRAGKMWVVAEVFLFILVGASIKLEYLGMYFLLALGLLSCGLFFRLCSVYLCLIKTGLSLKEKSFVAIAYVPKATVQAAIGGGLLDLGTSLGNEAIIAAGIVVLSVAVVSIILTAPLGAVIMNLTYKKLLPDDSYPLEKKEK